MRRERYIVHDNGVIVKHKSISRRQGEAGQKTVRAGDVRSRRAHFYTSPSGCMKMRPAGSWHNRHPNAGYASVACGSDKGASPFRCYAAIPITRLNHAPAVCPYHGAYMSHKQAELSKCSAKSTASNSPARTNYFHNHNFTEFFSKGG